MTCNREAAIGAKIQLTKDDQREILENAILLRDSRIPDHSRKLKVLLHRGEPVVVLAKQPCVDGFAKLQLILPFSGFVRYPDPFWVPGNANTRLIFKNERMRRRRQRTVLRGWAPTPRPDGFENVELKAPEMTQQENAVFMSHYYGTKNSPSIAGIRTERERGLHDFEDSDGEPVRRELTWGMEIVGPFDKKGRVARAAEVLDESAFENELKNSDVYRQVVVYGSTTDEKKYQAMMMICRGAKVQEAVDWLNENSVEMTTAALTKWTQRIRSKIEEPQWSAKMLTRIAAAEQENTRDFLRRLSKRKPDWWNLENLANSQTIPAIEYTGADVHLTRKVSRGEIKNGSPAIENIDVGELIEAGCD
jgi:hypothetical protein